MVGQVQNQKDQVIPQSFSSCLEYFGVPDLDNEQLSYGEVVMKGICHRLFDLGIIDFSEEDLAALDKNNKAKLAKIIAKIFDEW